MVLLAAMLAVGSPADDAGLPGDVWVFGGVGVTLDQRPMPRLNGGAIWFPYAKSAWGGLNRVSAGAAVVSTVAPEGNAGLVFSIGYGHHPRPALWLDFEAGLGFFVGWQPENELGAAISPTASLRIGYSFLALRLLGFISGGHQAVFHGVYYGGTLEGYWQL